MADLEKIAEDLSSLTVLEAADLAKILEDKWGVSAAAPVAGGAPVMMMEEAYDGGSSGLGVGLLIGATIAMISLLVILASEFQGASSVLTQAIAGNLWIWTGGLLAGAIIAGGIGLFIGRASE